MLIALLREEGGEKKIISYGRKQKKLRKVEILGYKKLTFQKLKEAKDTEKDKRGFLLNMITNKSGNNGKINIFLLNI